MSSFLRLAAVTVMSCLALAMGQSPAGATVAAPSEPVSYTATLSGISINVGSSLKATSETIYRDAVAQEIRIDTTLANGDVQTVLYRYDVNPPKMYTILNGTCAVTETPSATYPSGGTFPSLFPGVPFVYLGQLRDNGQAVESWVGSSRGELTILQVGSNAPNTPVDSLTVGLSFSTWAYTTFTAGRPDPGVFAIPAICTT